MTVQLGLQLAGRLLRRSRAAVVIMTADKVVLGRGRRRRAVGGLAVCALAAMLFTACRVAPAAASAALPGPHVFGWGFNDPDAVSSDGTHVWVANSGGDSVTELDAATGALVKVILGARYQFNYPDAVSSDASHVWVANYYGDSVTELDAATGALVKVLSGARYGFGFPDAVSADGSHVWVTSRGDSVTE
jgi:streptogramin lyase